MKSGILAIVAVSSLFVVTAFRSSESTPASAFTLTSSKGKSVNLTDFKGKWVVLEWWNYQCPFVQKHYNSGNMQKTQKQLTDKGVVWLTICSSAPGKQGHVSAEQAEKILADLKGNATHVLFDPEGKVGKMYNAKTTPQMVLISPDKQEVLYNGAIDDIRSANIADIAKAENLILRAYNEASNGKAVSIPYKEPYGCNVKYP